MRYMVVLIGSCIITLTTLGLYIRQRMNILAELYAMQRYEKIRQSCLEERRLLTQTLALLKDPTLVKKCATEQLAMKKVDLSQIYPAVIDAE